MAKVTIDDVAAQAGVSIKTVSRVINGEPHVRPAKREAVLAAVRELGYQPSMAARALAGARSYVLAMPTVYPTTAAYINELQAGAMSACRSAGYYLVVEQMYEGDELVSRMERLIGAVRPDGAILPPPVCNSEAVMCALEKIGVPYVRIAPDRDPARAPYAHMDDFRAVFDMINHLLALGHRRIALIRGSNRFPIAHLREAGFRAAMARGGGELRPEWIVDGEFDFQSGVQATQSLLALEERPTAIFASNDEMALGAIRAATLLGVQVPADLSIAGFDDAPMASLIWPQLTTVRQPLQEMARAAVDLLIGAARGTMEPRAMLLDYAIMARGTSAPPAK